MFWPIFEAAPFDKASPPLVTTELISNGPAARQLAILACVGQRPLPGITFKPSPCIQHRLNRHNSQRQNHNVTGRFSKASTDNGVSAAPHRYELASAGGHVPNCPVPDSSTPSSHLGDILSTSENGRCRPFVRMTGGSVDAIGPVGDVGSDPIRTLLTVLWPVETLANNHARR